MVLAFVPPEKWNLRAGSGPVVAKKFRFWKSDLVPVPAILLTSD